MYMHCTSLKDHIESNVESVAVNMENATGELQKANEYQKRARNRMLWIIVIILIVVVIISAIIFR